MNERSPKVTWTPELIATVRDLAAQGRSASQIAVELGRGLTRNAVIGKLHRLRGGVLQTAPITIKVATRRAAAKGANGSAVKRSPAPRKPTALPPVRLPVRFDSLGDALLALDETPGQPCCRWPMNIDQPSDIRFCLKPATHSAHKKAHRPTYCEAHALRSKGLGTPSEQRAHHAVPVNA